MVQPFSKHSLFVKEIHMEYQAVLHVWTRLSEDGSDPSVGQRILLWTEAYIIVEYLLRP